jgi:parallel beta-helix repeat protein
VYCLNSSPVLTSCRISGNGAGDGGGVYCRGDSCPILTSCTISGNYALVGCGGVDCGGNSSGRLTNCTISGNSSGVYCWNSSSPVLINCTISGNRDRGLYCPDLGASATLTNCILWSNGPASDCGDLSHCLTTEDPLFVQGGVFDFTRFVTVEILGSEHSLPDFIVEPSDYHLLEGSPAIDAGTCEGAPERDIVGTRRPQGAGCDIGAYEYTEGPPAVAFVRGDANSDGKVDISDAIAVLGYLFLGGAEPSCLESANADDTSVLDLTDAVYLLGHLFLGGPAPPAPYPGCGLDGTADALGCERFDGCAR